MPKNVKKALKQKVRCSGPSVAKREKGIGEDLGRSIGRAADVIVPRVAAAIPSLATLVGMGKYKVRENSIMLNSGTGVPRMHSRNNSIRYKDVECLGDVFTSTGFQLTQYEINPGLSTFPKLSGVAANFQYYKWRGLAFYYEALSANALNSTNTALGSITLVPQYQADCPAPGEISEMLNESNAVDTKPSEDCVMLVECAPNETTRKSFYIRTGPLGAGGVTQDLKEYDMVRLDVGTNASQAVSNAGRIWAAYDVELFAPIPAIQFGLTIPSLHFLQSSQTPTNAVPWPSTYFTRFNNIEGDNNVPAIIVPGASGGSLAIPPNSLNAFQLMTTWVGTSTAITAPSFTTSNLKVVATYYTNTNSNQLAVPVSGSTTTKFTHMLMYQIADQTTQAVLTIGTLATLPASVTFWEMIVTAIPSAFT